MTDVSTTSTYTEQDTTITTIENYFGETVTLDALAQMSDAERTAYFEQLYATGKISEDEITEFETALQDELDAYYTTLYTYNQELQAMLDSGNITVAEASNIELIMADLQEWMELCDEGIGTDWGNAVDDYNSQNVTVADGDAYTLDDSGASNGDNYTITCESDSATGTDGSSFNTEENADDLDLDGDGYNETNPDANGDLIADDDYDGDGIITEADMTYGTSSSPTTVILDDTGSYYVESYDAATDTLKLKHTLEDGTITYITIVGAEKIIMPPPTNYESLDTTLLAKMYENEASTNSFYYHVYGNEPNESGTYYSIYNMADISHSMTVTPSTEDFENERSYTVNCTSGTTDMMSFSFPADAVIEYSYDDDGNILMEVTSGGHTIEITLVGYEDSTTVTDTATADSITVNGETVTLATMGLAPGEPGSDGTDEVDGEEEDGGTGDMGDGGP